MELRCKKMFRGRKRGGFSKPAASLEPSCFILRRASRVLSKGLLKYGVALALVMHILPMLSPMAQAVVNVPGNSLATKNPDRTKANSRNSSPAVPLVAGSIAGAVEASITYPFEYAKTRVQLRSNSPAAAAKSPLEILRATISQHGFLSVYTGCGSLVAGTALKASVRFLTYDSIKQSLLDEHGRLSPARGTIAGMAAGAVESVVAVTPTERIKTALVDDAKHQRRFRSTFHAIQTIIHEQGTRGIYRGLLSTTIKQSATSAVRMGSYNVMRTKYQDRIGQPGTLGTFGIGAAAGVVTVYATQPFDTLKTRAQGMHRETMSRAVRGIIAQTGFRGLWSGSTMRLGRLVMSGGIVFSVYEQVAAQLSSIGW